MKRALLAAAAAASLFPSAAQAADYTVTGTYNETCTCGIGCQATLQPGTGGHREVTIAFRIEKGTFGGLDLAGRTIVAVIGSTGGKRTGTLYVDWDAKDSQRKALEHIFQDRFAKAADGRLPVKQVPIRFESGRAGIFTVSIPNILTAKIHRIPGTDGKDVMILNSPAAMIPELHLAISDEHRFEDKTAGRPWDIPAGRNGYFGGFDFTGTKLTEGERIKAGLKKQ